jgi:hypothetical protein
MSQTTSARFRAASVVIAPAVLLAGFVFHPHIGLGPLDPTVVGAAVVAEPTRWGLAHLAIGLGSGLAVLAFLAIHGFLGEAGEERWSGPALPFIAIGSTLYAMLPGMEFAPLAATLAGADARAAQAALVPWFVPVLLAAAAVFAVGALGFAVAIARSRVLRPRVTWLVVGGLGVLAVGRFVPLSAFQLYVEGAAGILALWPLAFEMWQRAGTRPVSEPQMRPA